MGVGAMAEPANFAELEQQIEAVLQADSIDFFELAEMLGLDPKQDFVGADLSGVDLSGKDLSYANFTRATLRGANFSNSNLNGADFTDANLSSPMFLEATKAVESARSLEAYPIRSFFYDRARNRARDLSLGLNFDSEFDSKFIVKDYDDIDLIVKFQLIRALASALVITFFDLDLVLARTQELFCVFDHALALARSHNRDEISSTLNKLQRKHLGATFRNANLQSVCWNGAHLEGASMINCQGLAPEDVANLKARGVIFDDAPGERSPVNSPRLPLPV
jgi:uncharacterized protein YjbI with pentapeptide repeats